MKNILFFICSTGLIFINSCNYFPAKKAPVSNNNPFLNRALNDRADYYYFDFKSKAKISSTLPIGVFDSGTGGLTVLNALVNYDQFDNSSNQPLQAGDGINDFQSEQFIYFGDQANMPYGNYAEAGKTGFLKELILKDALFLLGNKYYRTPYDKIYQTDKSTVKLMVIACNTATAYGKNDIENMISSEGSKIKVIGVIDAGVRGALATFKKDESGTIAVLATAGTVSSNGYLNTFNSQKNMSGYAGNIELIQHAGAGIAEAIDREPNYIAGNAVKPRKDYKGPSLSNDNFKIKKELMGIYNFDTINNSLLFELKNNHYTELQLNSPENYMRFHLVSLCEELAGKQNIKPLKTLILGCTHYPYLSRYIQKTLKELYNLKICDKYVYRNVLYDNVILVDPAINTAKETYEYLLSNNLCNKKGDINKSEFFISVPDNLNPEIKTDSLNWFTFDYKYSRNENNFYDTKQVPVSRLNTDDAIIRRFREQIPAVFELIKRFNSGNNKTSFLKPEYRF